MDIKPCGNRVVIKIEEKKDVSDGGILLPDSHTQWNQFGEVLAVGPGEWNPDGSKHIPVDLSVGDRVLYDAFKENAIEVGSNMCFILDARRVMAVIENGDTS